MFAFIWVLAAGGGGSSGFGGGGGGGGFSGGGGGFSGGGGGFSGGGGGFSGGGGGTYVGTGGGGGFLFFVILAVFFFFVLPVIGTMRVRAKRARDGHRREQRAGEVHLAAAEATEDDEHFSPDVVGPAARTLFMSVQEAWDARDLQRLSGLAGADLFAEWRLRLADFAQKGWHNRVAVTHEPKISYVGLDNRIDDAEDRAVVAVECLLQDYVLDERTGASILRDGATSPQVRLCEYWTLAWTPGGWRVDSIQSEDEGAYQLDAPLRASPWSDDGLLRDEALVEGAVADAPAAGSPAPRELVDVDYADDARAAALDLSLVDGRFAPVVLEAAVRRVVDAWVAAVDGADHALERLATPEGVHELLYPRGGDAIRLVIRGAVVEAVRIAELRTEVEPAELEVEVVLRGRRYEEDRATAAVVSGSRERETSSNERLVLRLEGTDPAAPWRVVGRSTAGARGGDRIAR